MTPHYPLKPIVVASFRSLALVAGTFLLSSCSVFDNDLPFLQQARDDVAQVSPWPPLSVGEQTAFLGDLLASERLDALVTEALTANPSLQQTLLTLQIRQAERRETNASRLPSVDAGLTATREENTSGDGSNDSYTSSLTVSWEVDLWSKLADGVAAVDRDIDEQRALYQSARDTLAAEVMQAWVSLVASKRGIAIEERRVATLESNTDFILSRYRNGLGELEDLQSARSSLASARANLVEEQENLEQNLRALREMLGRTVDLDVKVPEDFPSVAVPLTDLPPQTLARRPDLRAAYAAIEAATLRSRVAYKDMLPSINLQAALEDVAASPADALMAGPVWSLLSQLTAPLWQGGALRAQADIAELETAQAYQSYRETLLTAVREVEDALGQERSLAERQAQIETALESARNNLTIYQQKYRSGLADILDLLTVQEQAYDLEAQLNELVETRLNNRIGLGLALGLGARE